MALTHRKDYYEELERKLKEDFGYGDELSSDGGFADLMENGVICDSVCKRIPGKKGRTAEDRIDSLGGRLKDGETLYIYKKGERFPHEVKYNATSGEVEISEKPVNPDKEPEKPAEHRPKWYQRLFNRYLDLIARMYGGRNSTCQKWDEYDDAVKARKNMKDERRLRRRERNDEALGKRKTVENKNKKEAYESFISALKNELGYDKELTAKGESGLEDILRNRVILDKNGNPLPELKNRSLDDRIDQIGKQLYDKQNPLYVYKKGEDYPREIYIDRNGKLVVTEPINKLNNQAAEPSWFQRWTSKIGWKNSVTFDHERAEIRKDLLEKVSSPAIHNFYKKMAEDYQKENQPAAEEKKEQPAVEEKKVSAPEEKKEAVAAEQQPVQEKPAEEPKVEAAEPKKSSPMTLEEEKEALLDRIAQIDKQIGLNKNLEVTQAESLTLEKEVPAVQEVKKENVFSVHSAANVELTGKAELPKEKEPVQEKTSELDQLLGALQKKNGGEKIPDTLRDVVTEMYHSARFGKQSLQQKCEKGGMVSGGAEIKNMVIFNAVKKDILDDKVPFAEMNYLQYNSATSVMKEATMFCEDIVYFSKFSHDAKKVQENVLSEKGLDQLTEKYTQKFNEVVDNNFTNQQAFDKALEKADLRYNKAYGPAKDDSKVMQQSNLSKKVFGEKLAADKPEKLAKGLENISKGLEALNLP